MIGSMEVTCNEFLERSGTVRMTIPSDCDCGREYIRVISDTNPTSRLVPKTIDLRDWTEASLMQYLRLYVAHSNLYLSMFA